MRQESNGRFAHKVTALLLVLVMMVALPIMAQATDDVPDVPEGAVRIMPWSYEILGSNSTIADVGFDILNVTSQRVIYDMEEIRGWPRYELLMWAGEWMADSIVVFYVEAPGIVVPVNFINRSWSLGLPFFGVELQDQINETIVRTFIACDDCEFCYYGLDCDFPSVTTSGYLTFSEPGPYPFVHDGHPLFLLVVEGEATPPLQPTPEPDAPTTAPNLATASSWAHDSINSAYVVGLIPQALQSHYTQATTRAEFATLAVALYETATGREITERTQFNDTTDVNVQKMAGLGVVMGVGDGNFAPDRTITRQETAVLLARLAYVIGQPLPASAPTFADNASIASWAVDGVGQMQAAGIMSGVGDNIFDPNGTYTREQSIVTMLRLFDLLS